MSSEEVIEPGRGDTEERSPSPMECDEGLPPTTNGNEHVTTASSGVWELKNWHEVLIFDS